MVARETIRNPLVLRMTEPERESLGFERIELRKHAVLGRIDEPMTHYAFIERGLVCTVRTMADDRTCTIGQIDNRGMIGIGGLFLTDRSTADYVVALPGVALRVEREKLRGLLRRNPDLDALFKQLAHVAWGMNSQISACNRLHVFEQRFCRWLMVASNAIDADLLPMNQTEIARLLGLTRQQVRRGVQQLTAAGLVEMVSGQRWSVRLINKPGIEANACECYRTIAGRFEKIFSNALHKNDFSMNGATYVSRTAQIAGISFLKET